MWKRELLKNKVYALLFMLIGFFSFLIEYDATAFVFTLLFGLPLFFAKENWITEVGMEIIEDDQDDEREECQERYPMKKSS